MTTVWVHEVSPCAGCLDVFHSNRTLVLALDTDPGVDPNQKQGARPVLRHMNEAYQTCKASKWLCKCLICSGDFEAYHAADGFHGLICLRANTRLAQETIWIQNTERQADCGGAKVSGTPPMPHGRSPHSRRPMTDFTFPCVSSDCGTRSSISPSRTCWASRRRKDSFRSSARELCLRTRRRATHDSSFSGHSNTRS